MEAGIHLYLICVFFRPVEPIYALALVITGAVAGFSSGMLGVGGCFIMVPIQFWVLTSMGVEPTLATRISFGTALAVALPTAVNAALGHHRKGAVVTRAALLLGLAGLAGAFIGGAVASQAPGDLLRTAFGVVVIAAALRMVTAPDIEASADPSGISVPRKGSCYLLLGLPVGFVSGLVGIGGGVIMVPILSTAMGFGIHRAVGTSSAAIILTSSGGVLSYVYNGLGVPGLPSFSLGYINLLQVALLAGASIPAARIGVRAAHRLPAERLRAIFTLVMVYMGLRMMGAFELFHLPI